MRRRRCRGGGPLRDAWGSAGRTAEAPRDRRRQRRRHAGGAPRAARVEGGPVPLSSAGSAPSADAGRAATRPSQRAGGRRGRGSSPPKYAAKPGRTGQVVRARAQRQAAGPVHRSGSITSRCPRATACPGCGLATRARRRVQRAGKAENDFGYIPLPVGHLSNSASTVLRARSASSWYFSTAPSVAAARSGSSERAPNGARPGPSRSSRRPRRLEEIGVPQSLGRSGDIPGEPLGDIGQPAKKNRHLPIEARMWHPVVEAATLERVVHFPRAVGRQDHQRGHLSPNRAQFRDRHGIVGQNLEQKRLELVVCPVNFINEQHGRRVFDRAEDRARDEISAVVQRALQLGLVQAAVARRFGRAQVQHLPREVPVVEGLRGVDSLVTLQPNELGAETSARARARLVLPTPASPSRKSGRCIRKAR